MYCFKLDASKFCTARVNVECGITFEKKEENSRIMKMSMQGFVYKVRQNQHHDSISNRKDN